MRLIQIESLLVKADILYLPVIMSNAVPWMETSRYGGWICYTVPVRHARDIMNSFSKCSIMPLLCLQCLRNWSISLRSSKTRVSTTHSTTG